MRPLLHISSLACAASLLCATALCATKPAASTIAFKDPSKPGTLRLIVAQGDIRITGSDTPGQLTLSNDQEQQKQAPREDGLRELGAAKPAVVNATDNNTIHIDLSQNDPFGAGNSDLNLSVPRDTRLEIENSLGGSVHIEGLRGETSVQGLACDVELIDCVGATSVETLSGDIRATFAQLAPSTPISLSSLSGNITVRVPADTKAQVRFRTHTGAILTDFAEDQLKTVTESTGPESWGAAAGEHAAVAAKVAREIGMEVARLAKTIAEETKEAVHEARDGAKREAREPRQPRKPGIPAISGGRVVSGDLNGGGAPFQITSLNGDITFRKRDAKP